MPTLIAYDNNDLNHVNVQEGAIGASQYHFYNLLAALSLQVEKVICFNSTKKPYNLDRVEYRPLSDIKTYALEPNDFALVQRFYPRDAAVRTQLARVRTYVWVHDIVNVDVFTEYNTEQSSYFSAHPSDFAEQLEDVFFRNTEFIFVSQSQKEKAVKFFERYIAISDAKLHVIPNIVWDHQFALSKKPQSIDSHTIVYASAWQKGINHVIALYEKLLATIPDLKLTLLSPGYDHNRFQDYEKELTEKFGGKITILGPVSKTKLGETIMTAAAVIAPPFEETFGSVFAESLSLGTPVIASHKSGAVIELVGPDWIFDFTDVQKISDRLQLVISQRMRGSLNEKFCQEKNISLWLDLLCGKKPSIVKGSAPLQSEKSRSISQMATDAATQAQRPIIKYAQTELGNYYLVEEDYISEFVRSSRLHEPHFLPLAQLLIAPGSNTIDLGAYIGTHTVLLSRLTGEGQVFAFEPLSLSYSQLQLNILANNLKNVTAYKLAATNYTGDYLRMESVDYTATQLNIGAVRVGKWSTGDEVLSVKVDDLRLPPIAFVKMDVQGSEFLAVEGMRDLLLRDQPLIFVAIEEHHLRACGTSSKDLIELLFTLGYALLKIQSAYPCDHLAVPLSKLSEVRDRLSNSYPYATDLLLGSKVQLAFKSSTVVYDSFTCDS